MTSIFLDVFVKKLGELSVVHSQRLVVAYLLDAAVSHNYDHVNFRKDCQGVRRKHASLK